MNRANALYTKISGHISKSFPIVIIITLIYLLDHQYGGNKEIPTATHLYYFTYKHKHIYDTTHINYI